MRAIGLLLGIVALVGWVPPVAGECIDYGEYVQWVGGVLMPHKARDVAIAGECAYVSCGWSEFGGYFYVLDISDPETPTIVGSLATQGLATSVAALGPYAFVTDDAVGVRVVDVADPAEPVSVATVNLPGSAQSSVIASNYLYVGCQSPGSLQVVDISNPSSPVRVGGVQIPPYGGVVDVAVVGSNAYLACTTSGFIVVDVSNPASPALIGSLSSPRLSWGVAVSGGRAFVSQEVFESSSHLSAIDISDPTSPTLLGSVVIPGRGRARAVEVMGEYVLVSDQESGLQVVDVSAPNAPVHVGSVDVPSSSWGITRAGNHLFLADYWYVDVVDISNPESPAAIGGVDTPDDAQDIAVAGDYAYIADLNSGLQVIDVTDPASPSIAGAVDTPGGAIAVEVVGSHAYVADGPSGLQIIDVHKPASPTIVGSVDTPSGARGVKVSGQYAYVADSFAGLQVIDISSVTAPTIVGGVVTFRARGVAVRYPFAYVADADEGLKVVDISNPKAPALRGIVDTPGSAQRVEVVGNYAFVADRGISIYDIPFQEASAAVATPGGIQIVDISDPDHPYIIGSADTPDTSWDVEVVGPYAYIADGSIGVHVVDCSDPTTPLMVGSGATTGKALGIVVRDDLAYVANGSSGLKILPVQCAGTSGIGESPSSGVSGPVQLALSPNPSGGVTSIRFQLPGPSGVRLAVYDPAGRLVRQIREGSEIGGQHLDVWDGRDDHGVPVARGIYLIRLSWSGGVAAGSLTVLR